ncbi:MAG: DUF3780 domain-containing protein [Verrucomicrobia bacterium]|nr:DUF3780 domain-containing protein [Verrucomicrobiota bacterium]
MKNREAFEGFGALREFGTPHFRVEIPRNQGKPVVIYEDFGLTEEQCTELKRAALPRAIWSKIAKDLAADFNLRLKARKLPVGAWTTGTVKVERILGKELCVLAWAVESFLKHDPEIEQAIARWKALRPEERWWLFTMAAAEGGLSEQVHSRWRTALRVAIGGIDQERETRRIIKEPASLPPMKQAHQHPEFSFMRR